MKRPITEEAGDENRRHPSAKPAGVAVVGAKRTLLLVAGSFSLLLALLGAILPVMPTSPFLVLSVYCYARSSARCYRWLTTNRLVGRYLNYVAQGRRLPPPVKVALIASSWMTAAISALLLAPNLPLKIVSLSMAAAMSAYIVFQGRRRTLPETAGARRPVE